MLSLWPVSSHLQGDIGDPGLDGPPGPPGPPGVYGFPKGPKVHSYTYNACVCVDSAEYTYHQWVGTMIHKSMTVMHTDLSQYYAHQNTHYNYGIVHSMLLFI